VLRPRELIRVPITMPGWLVGNLHFVVAAVVAAALLAVYHRWRASSLRRHVRLGGEVTFNAWLRGSAAPYPRRWREGQVHLGFGAPSWKPRLGIVRRPVALPMSAVVQQIRRVSGVREIFSVDANCMVIVAHGDDATMELGVHTNELASVVQALESRSGGGWQVPPTIPVSLEEDGEVTTYELKGW